MPIVHNAHVSGHVTQQERVIGDIGIVIRVRIPAPLQVAESASVTRIVTAFLRAWRESLAYVVGSTTALPPARQ